MTFRTKLLLITSLTVAGAVALATGAVSLWTRRTFEQLDRERRQALLRQFERELGARGAEVALGMERAAASATALRIANEAGRSNADLSLLVNDAQELAEKENLDFVEVLQPDLTILSSAHWPARFGYKNNWLIARPDWDEKQAFLTRVPLPEGTAVALMATRRVMAGDKGIILVGARRLDSSVLASLGSAPGMRALLWFSAQQVLDPEGALAQPGKLAGLAAAVERSGREESAVVDWGSDTRHSEAIQAMPLRRGGQLMGILMAGTMLDAQLRLQRSILLTGVLVSLGGILLGLLIGLWTTERVTRPVMGLAAGARAVAGGDWSTRVPVTSEDEIGELARSFNTMTAQLIEQRDRALQAERVAAWRELARRLAHELKNPLFPLQITVENLRKAYAQQRPEFDQIFAECTSTLLDEMANLRTIIGRFSDFAKMPVPQLAPTDLNDVVRGAMKLFDAQFQTEGRPKIECVMSLAREPLPIECDREQLGRALRNLVLNAMDAMPEGGQLSVRTARTGDVVCLEVADTGQGLTPEESARLFTPYYTSKRHGTGLGLAIVQSVVSDHHGHISVQSDPGSGACFSITLPAADSRQEPGE
ncbi:MAG: HAMP domain-containing protein [Bryobacterales bacterium]|nr:HAMP domain-containing protein [Bryobacterales bacterium]